MACGTPVLASHIPAIQETAGNAALLMDPFDVHAIAGGLRCLLDDPILRADLIEAGFARARHFTWESVAARTADLLAAV